MLLLKKGSGPLPRPYFLVLDLIQTADQYSCLFELSNAQAPPQAIQLQNPSSAHPDPAPWSPHAKSPPDAFPVAALSGVPVLGSGRRSWRFRGLESGLFGIVRQGEGAIPAFWNVAEAQDPTG